MFVFNDFLNFYGYGIATRFSNLLSLISNP